MSPNNLVIAIVATYLPDVVVLRSLLDALAHQVKRTVVVDNTPQSDHRVVEVCDSIIEGTLELVRLGENQGLGVALNIGLSLAMKENPKFVLLSDQDSLPAQDMAKKLMSAHDALVKSGKNIGAIGPTFIDLHSGLTHSFQVSHKGRCFYGHQIPTEAEPHVETLTLITSGTLISTECLRNVGLMREDFFIDQIDAEWCHRARSQGYSLFGTGWGRMHQRLGDDNFRIWFFGWKTENLYSPLRIYYRVRNYIVMLRLPYIDVRWKVRSGLYWTKVSIAHLFFTDRRLETSAMIGRAVFDGIFGHLGRYGR